MPGVDSSPSAGRLEEVAPGVHAWVQPDGSWWINNAGVVSSSGEALIVDTCATVERTRRFLGAAMAGGQDTIRFAVNTHQHGDHCYGNELLPRSTVLIGHQRMREGLAADPVIDACPPYWAPLPRWGASSRRLPDVTVKQGLTIHVGDLAVEVLHPGHTAHTTGDLVVWLPGSRVLFAGDLVFSGSVTPLVFMGSVDGARTALDWIEDLAPLIVVPGHGPVLRDGDIADTCDALRRYYDLVTANAASGLTRGWSALDTARAADLGEFAQWNDPERIVLNLHRAYADHRGELIDVPGAFSDAVTFLGGPMRSAV